MKRIPLLLCSAVLLISTSVPGNGAVDLREAYQIASTEAVVWDPSAKPYFITSVDDDIESQRVKGEDGRRHNWNFDFVAENTSKHLILTLHNKTVVSKMEAESYVNSDSIIPMEELCISTAEAVTVAKTRYGLLPGTDWAQGYHFVLENDGSALILSVVGRNKTGAMSRVFFHAKTGEVIAGVGEKSFSGWKECARMVERGEMNADSISGDPQ